MDLQNPWFVIAIFGVLASYHAELIAEFLNLSRLPKRSEAAEGNENLIEYNSAMAKADVVRSSAMLALLLGFWFVGGFGWLDQWTRSFG
jgi:STE24 endopeptidase